MTGEEFQKMVPGLYLVHWADGARSLAAVGVGEGGERWLAPVGWVRPSTSVPWPSIASVELLHGTAEDVDRARARLAELEGVERVFGDLVIDHEALALAARRGRREAIAVLVGMAEGANGAETVARKLCEMLEGRG